jgi:hypothetical protein
MILFGFRVQIYAKQALRRQWFAGVRPGELGGSEPRAAPYYNISEEESNLFCACHLLNCDERQGQ